MLYFAVPYRVLFHDTMAYGTHHFLTNFKFQCEAREQLLFAEVLANAPDEGKSLRDILFLTQQAYSRNLAAVKVGEMVGILLSFEDATDSSLRFCFRAVRHDGAPVACGFQTIVCISKRTQTAVPAPPPLYRYRETLREPLTGPDFASRVLAGKLREVFSDEVVRIGMGVARTRTAGMYPQAAPHAETDANAPAVDARGPAATPSLGRGTVLLFPGQGSFDWSAFKQLKDLSAENVALLRRVDEISQAILGRPLRPLIETADEAGYRALLRDWPDVVQLGAYLSGWMGARLLLEQGLEPDALTGHSAGELTALAVGGGYSVEEGAELLCKRMAALASLGPKAGGMVALLCGPRRARGIIDALGETNATVAVLNHSEQTVVSGRDEDLERLSQIASHLQIGCERLQSRYPFHSELLQPAAERFSKALGMVEIEQPSIPVYSPMEGSFYVGGLRLSSVLPSHFVRPLDFGKAVEELYRMGARQYVGCGGGAVIAGLVKRILKEKEDVRALSAMPSGVPLQQGVERAVSECGGVGRQALAWSVGAAAKAARRDVHRSEPLPDSETPVAIVGLGCVLPGADSPKELWANVKDGVSAIVDMAVVSPDNAADFLSPGAVMPDKTYTLLCGLLNGHDTRELPPALRDMELSSSQSILASATAQCMARLKLNRSQRVACYIGSTADGTAELDEALVLAGLEEFLTGFGGDAEKVESLRNVLRRAFGRSAEAARQWSPYPAWKTVVHKLLGEGAKVLAIDAACASSLYTIGLGINALRDGVCDVVFCGGAFFPGPANSALFSQFRGLSANGSRPFDSAADGVVFSPGAAVIALRRLPDALAAGEHVFALVRGFGTSSDGKSVSVAEPKRDGQLRALRRAYARSGIDPTTIQYVEAHATSTPVGDAVEFSALKEMFRGSRERSVGLGSIKALIGHTGWAAGAASVVKVCAALEARVLPPQANFSSPNPNIDLDRSPFVIPTKPSPWPRASTPRRAGVNGFGFGGTNAHIILEEYEGDARGVQSGGAWPAAVRRTLALVGIGSLFPAGGPLARDQSRLHFAPNELRLPVGKRLLPEMMEQIDRGQFLALMATEQALEPLRGRWESWRDEIGVVFGLEAKTSRSLGATQRIYADSLRRRLREARTHGGAELSDEDWLRLEEALLREMRRISPSNPYSLPGMMPNIVAGRVSNIFDLHGPNFVVDAGSASLIEAISIAEVMIRRGECELVLTGGICGNERPESRLIADQRAGSSRPIGDAALVLALTSAEKAQAEGLDVIAELSLSAEAADSDRRLEVGRSRPYLMGAEGALEIALALEHCRQSGLASTVFWPEDASGAVPELRCIPRATAHKEQAQAAPASDEARQREPVYICAPRMQAVPAETPRTQSLAAKKILALVDQPEAIHFLKGLRCTVLCPAGSGVLGAAAIDLTTEETIADGLRQIDRRGADMILVIKTLGDAEPDAALAEGARGRGLLELSFAVARHCYDGLREGAVSLAAVCAGAWRDGRLDAYTGLLGGFVKSLSRELPQSTAKVIYTDENAPALVLSHVETELSQGPLPAPVEIAYKGGERFLFRLARLPRAARGAGPLLKAESVVLATGGGRGVTASLVEEVLAQAPCTVFLLGRTNPDTLPPHLRGMSDEEFDAFETTFYQQELARSPGTAIGVLRARYQEYRSARELLGTLNNLRSLPGRVSYRRADITDAAAVDGVVCEIIREHGRIDLVLHGAGLQVSRTLRRKKVEEFRGIVATKLGGLRNLRDACLKHLRGREVYFHLLTSAFSFFGNDGQPDYGAANEAMNRFAEQFSEDGTWTSIAWLGWAGVGMTRGSEYAALARARGLRPLARDEGKKIFSQFLRGRPLSPVNILVTEGERAFYGLTYALDCEECAPLARVVQWPLSVAEQPYLSDHKVNGVPTLPGTFEIDMAVRSAHEVRPERALASVEDATFDRFVRLHNGGPMELRARTHVLRDDDHETLVRVELYSDFVHKTGIVLQKNLRHFCATVRLADQIRQLPTRPQANGHRGIMVSDPYLDRRAPVSLSGFFQCLERIEIHEGRRSGSFRVKDATKLPQLRAFHIPSVLLDSLCRFAMIHVTPDGEMPLYVPTRCRRALIAPGLNDLALHAGGAEIFLFALTPRVEGEVIHNERAEASDASGRTLLIVEGLSAHRARAHQSLA